MKPFDYKEQVRQYRRKLDAKVAEFIFRSKDLPYARVGRLFNLSGQRIKEIAKAAGILRGQGWRPQV
jgi:hypothetical protein